MGSKPRNGDLNFLADQIYTRLQFRLFSSSLKEQKYCHLKRLLASKYPQNPQSLLDYGREGEGKGWKMRRGEWKGEDGKGGKGRTPKCLKVWLRP